jgi:hypothetical protein
LQITCNPGQLLQVTCDNRAGPGRRNPFATTENLVASNLPKMFHAEKLFHGKCSTQKKMFHENVPRCAHCSTPRKKSFDKVKISVDENKTAVII